LAAGLPKNCSNSATRSSIADRGNHALDETVAANPGMNALQLDIEHPASIRDFTVRVIEEFPSLNVLINNAGITRAEDLRAQQPNLEDAEAIVITNLLGPIRQTAALQPTFRRSRAQRSSMSHPGWLLPPWPLLPPIAPPRRRSIPIRSLCAISSKTCLLTSWSSFRHMRKPT
jgi:NAD(P)-dependent dehydrogenase (short-subunit alcohol dehydrogenase family)